ncbi:hypothetical protein [Cylindrospermopsis raciborskii]|uniref:hypothetical protein n=1 Tax=Cylindrospermopsis raciborskii TaxID=77022 RepID=UPI001454C741|nr:hypothetical protein [Cylindrospermopsis raciborskii]NLQ05510.1 hypothetical protein [Cylindrospermopsis raciborskii MVCC19]
MAREVYWGSTRYRRSHLPTFSFSKIAIAFLTAPIPLRRLNTKCDRTAVTMGDSPVNRLQFFP